MSERAWFVPGRIEILGKHTDYAGGRSLVCAVERGIVVMAQPRDDARVRVVDAAGGEVSFEIGPNLAPPAGHWSNYPMTVARRLARNFAGRMRGVDLAFASDLPQAAGLGSSSALVIATYLALADANELERRPEYGPHIGTLDDLATYLSCIEMGGSFGALAGDAGVGTRGGAQDQTAILCCRRGAVSQYGWRPVRHERTIAMPPGHRFIVGVSGVVADKTGAALEAYNRLARETEGLPERWPPARLEQFQAECEEIIPAVGDALERGAVNAIGRLVDRSQALAERCLRNQVPETVALQRSARELGAVAASAFGAGFGGSVWALVREDYAEGFREQWASRYRGEFPEAGAKSEFFVTRAGPGVTRL
ncbi:MAG: galactokinase family protein [Gemmatimonadota bacterium]